MQKSEWKTEKMKTLDGLIKDLTEMTANPTEGDYENEGYYLAKDTLHYLKEYISDKLQYEADRKLWEAVLFGKVKECEETRARYIAKLKELDIGTLNEPLTWEQLREMEGKPVYWTHDLVGEWLTIYGVPKNDDNVIYATTCSGVECWIYKKDMDKYKYYRKEKQ